MEEKKLNRSLSPLNVWSIALGCIIGWGAFVMPGNLFLDSAGPLGTAIGLSIGAIIMIIISLSYGYMIQRFPVAGGEFAYAYTSYGRTHAYICAWFLGLSYLSIVPLNTTALALMFRTLFPGLLQFGFLYTIAGWDVYLGEVLLSSFALILFGYTNIKGIKVSGKLQTVLALTLVSSILLLTIVALFSPNTDFNHLTPLFSPKQSPISGILSIIAIAPWAYVGFDAIPQAAEEFNFSSKKSLRIMIIAIILGGLMYISLNTITALVLPWQDLINSNPVWATGYAVEVLMGKTGLFILGIALLAAVLTGIIGFYMASSRLLYSIARASALPDWFAYLDPKTLTPKNSILFVMIISLLAPWFGRQVLLWIVDMASIGAAIGYFYTSSSTFLLLYREKSKLRLKWISLLGSILSIGFVLLLVLPGLPTSLAIQSRVALFVWVMLGIVFYLMSIKKYRNLSNEDLNQLIIKQ